MTLRVRDPSRSSAPALLSVNYVPVHGCRERPRSYPTGSRESAPDDPLHLIDETSAASASGCQGRPPPSRLDSPTLTPEVAAIDQMGRAVLTVVRQREARRRATRLVRDHDADPFFQSAHDGHGTRRFALPGSRRRGGPRASKSVKYVPVHDCQECPWSYPAGWEPALHTALQWSEVSSGAPMTLEASAQMMPRSRAHRGS